MKEKIILLSDIHDCHIEWYGLKTADRMEKMLSDLEKSEANEKPDLLLCMGDYSLDFWFWGEGGSYLHTPSVSNTDHFVKNYFNRLPKPAYMIPGNHEQYGHDDWKRITGFERSYTVKTERAVFVMLDNFSGNLDPKENSDGTYTQTDCATVRKALEENPDKPIFLCAHWFAMERESEEFKNLLASEQRVVALIVGHSHETIVLSTGDDAGNKPILQCGNYSYNSQNKEEPYLSFWGWRELYISDDGEIVTYYNRVKSTLPNGDVIEPAHLGEWSTKFEA